MDRITAVGEYYRALDGHDYDRLADLLASDFRQDRPDLTLEGRDRFVRFMREERPQTDTAHRLDGVFEGGTPHDEAVDRSAEPTDGRASGDGDPTDDAAGVAVQGRLCAADGETITGFVDVFTFGDGGRIRRIRTYTDR